MASVTSSPFAHLLKRLRAAAGLTQGELAERAGVSARAISDLERGIKHRPHADTVERLTRALNLGTDEALRFQAAARGSGVVAPSDPALQVEQRPVARHPGSSTPSDQETKQAPIPHLPVQVTSFVGRKEELRGLQEALLRDDVRLLTLTGPGGTGKTRLALQAAAELTGAFPHGSCFVSLASINDPRLVSSAVGQAVGLQEHRGQSLVATLFDHLRDRRLLLVLDNFEHVLEASPLVADLLAQCSALKVLVTSRAVLHLTAEHVYTVPALALPDLASLPEPGALARYDAVTLFLARAAAARADFVLTEENAPAVAEICHRLDGLPLAIELAAARIRLFPPHALLRRLSSRLGVLTGGLRDLPARQQTLLRTMDWSYALLDAQEQRLFRRLAVFAGGCTLQAAEAVCGGEGGLEVIQGVTSLLDQSLLSPVEVTRDEPRVVMLETVREYSLERLEESGEGEAQHQRHAEFYLSLAEEAEPALRGAAQTAWLPRLEQEHHNVREALRWCVETADAARGLRLAGALWRFWYVRSHFTEGRQWLAQVLALPSAAAPTLNRAKALNGAGNLAYSQGDLMAARACHEESLLLRRQLGDRRGVAASLNNLALLDREQGDYDTASRLLEEAIDLSQALEQRTLEALALGNLGTVRRLQDSLEAARVLHTQSRDLFTAEGDAWGRAMALYYLGVMAHEEGKSAEARTFYEESCVLRRQVGDRRGLALSLAGLGALFLYEGDVARARPLLAESLALREAIGDVLGLLDDLMIVAALAASVSQMIEAVMLASAVEALKGTPDRANGPTAVRAPGALPQPLDQGRRRLEAAAFESARYEGARLSSSQALSLARAVLDVAS